MTRDDERLRWIDASLTNVLKRVRHLLREDQIDQIEEFIYVGEFRLALENLVGYLAENGACPSADVLEEIDALIASMGMAPPFQADRAQLGRLA